jgi:alpha-glucosidase
MNLLAQTASVTPLTARAGDRDWWRGAVIYQIYPRSYQDSNGDGIGDLAGIVTRLPYIASLGVDAIWISPFFTSPMKDFGYDVSDYCDVDPMFGTLVDFDNVVAAAHSLGLRVLIDLVLSHTSDIHPWFAESRANRVNDKADWYVWSDPKEDGTPPNNWLSIFGGSAWQWDTRREQYYLHNFLVSQPDLNFHNPVVQDALLKVERFWLDRGVDGFRLDTLNFYVHDDKLRDNPPMPKELRNSSIAPTVNPYNYQEHCFDRNRPENLDFLRRFRAVMDEYGAAAVGEVGDAQVGLKLIGEYTSGDDLIQMCYAFDLIAAELPTARRIVEVMDRVRDQVKDGWCCWAFSNHDCVRHTTRWNLPPAAQRLMTTLMMSLRGSACIYQGEELGYTEADVAFGDLQDPYGVQFWPEFKGRDGCRTPMVWDSIAPHGGFSTAPRTWLPVSPAHLRLSAAAQESDPDALIHHYRRAIALRQAHAALKKGAQEQMSASGSVLHFVRADVTETLFCAFNLGDQPAACDLPAGKWRTIGGNLGGAQISGDGKLNLDPWQPCLAIRMNAEYDDQNGRGHQWLT